MADAVLQLVARLKSTTGLPEDTCENVIHIACDSATYTTDLVAAVTSFRDFYNVDHAGQGNALCYWISTAISRAANQTEILAYYTDDLTGATPFGAPVAALSFQLGAAVSTPNQMVDEVAVVLSLYGDLDVPVSAPNPTPPPATIRPQQRRRGRLFFGPLNNAAGAILTGGHFRPGDVLRADLGWSFRSMALEINALTDYTVGVWSKADAAVHPIIGGYVDDAWDTQRRRGVAATQRTVFAI